MNWAKIITDISLYIVMITGIIMIIFFLILAFDINIANALIISCVIFGTFLIVGFTAEYNDKDKF